MTMGRKIYPHDWDEDFSVIPEDADLVFEEDEDEFEEDEDRD